MSGLLRLDTRGGDYVAFGEAVDYHGTADHAGQQILHFVVIVEHGRYAISMRHTRGHKGFLIHFSIKREPQRGQGDGQIIAVHQVSNLALGHSKLGFSAGEVQQRANTLANHQLLPDFHFIEVNHARLRCTQGAVFEALTCGNSHRTSLLEVGLHLYPLHIADTAFVVHGL